MTHLPEVSVTRPDPHCRVWMLATASLWGMTADHDLDEPVRLSATVPVRLRHEVSGDNCTFILDRDLALKAERAGHHVMVRLSVRDKMFAEIDISPPYLHLGETANVTRYT